MKIEMSGPPVMLRLISTCRRRKSSFESRGYQWHADVVGSERRSHVEAENRELHGQEGHRLAPAAARASSKSGQPAEADGQEGDLDPAALDFVPAEDSFDARQYAATAPRAGACGKKYQPWWATSHRSSRLRCRVAIAGVIAIARRARSGSAPSLFGFGVVAGVLALPPAVADSHQQVRDDHADPVVPAAGLEHLPMCGVVAEKGDLGHGDTPGRRRWPVATSESPIHDEGRHPKGQERDGADQLGPVVAVAAAHQPHLMHGASQGRKRTRGFARPRRAAAKSGVRGRWCAAGRSIRSRCGI